MLTTKRQLKEYIKHRKTFYNIFSITQFKSQQEYTLSSKYETDCRIVT